MSNIEEDNSQLENQVTHALDSSIEDLHPDIRRKLNQARIKALQTKQSKPFFYHPLVKSAGVFSFVTLIALVTLDTDEEKIILSNSIANVKIKNNETSNKQITLNKLELEEVDLIEQLEFALWMAEEDQIASL